MRKLISFLLFIGLLSPLASALPDTDYLELIENTDNCLTDCYSVYTLKKPREYTIEELSKFKMSFQDEQLKNKSYMDLKDSKQISFYLWELVNYSVPVYVNNPIEWKNKTGFNDNYELDYYSKETRFAWIPTTIAELGSLLYFEPVGYEVNVKVEGKLNVGEALDNIFTFYNDAGVKEYKEYVWWNSSFALCRNLTITDLTNYDAIDNKPVRVNIDSSAWSSKPYNDTIRILNTSCDNNGTEVTSFINNITQTAGIMDSFDLHFQLTDFKALEERNYSIYFDTTTKGDAGYSTNWIALSGNSMLGDGIAGLNLTMLDINQTAPLNFVTSFGQTDSDTNDYGRYLGSAHYQTGTGDGSFNFMYQTTGTTYSPTFTVNPVYAELTYTNIYLRSSNHNGLAGIIANLSYKIFKNFSILVQEINMSSNQSHTICVSGDRAGCRTSSSWYAGAGATRQWYYPNSDSTNLTLSGNSVAVNTSYAGELWQIGTLTPSLHLLHAQYLVNNSDAFINDTIGVYSGVGGKLAGFRIDHRNTFGGSDTTFTKTGFTNGDINSTLARREWHSIAEEPTALIGEEQVDNAPPQIALSSPIDELWTSALTVDFDFTPTDDSGFANCSLYHNETGSWALEQGNATLITNGSINTITETFTSPVAILWAVQCTDNESSSNFSSNFTLNIKGNDSILASTNPKNDFTISSNSYVTGIQENFNTTSANTNVSAWVFFNLIKVSGGGSNEVFARVNISGTQVFEESLRSVSTINAQGSTGIKPFLFSVASGEHNITLEFRRTGTGSVEIDDIDFALIKFETNNGGVINAFNFSGINTSSSTSFESIRAFNFTKITQSPSWFYSKITANGSGTNMIPSYMITNGENSSISSRLLATSGSIGSLSVGLIESEAPTGFHAHNLEFKTNSSTVTTEYQIVAFDMYGSNNWTIGQFSLTNVLTNETNLLSLGAGSHNLTSSTWNITDGDSAYLYATLSMNTSESGTFTPRIVVNSSQTDAVCSSQKHRSLTGSGEYGNVFLGVLCTNLTLHQNYEFVLWVEVPVGKTINVLDETLMGFETTKFNTTVVNLPPIVNIINAPLNGTNVSGNYNFNWSAFSDPNGDTVTYNISAINGDGTLNTTLNASATDTNQTFDTTALNDFTYNLNVTGCDPSGLCATNSSENFTVDNTVPQLLFISSTPANNTEVTINYTTINVSVADLHFNSCLFDWAGTNETTTSVINVTGGYCFVNKTGLTDTTYIYSMYANDSLGLYNISQIRWVVINAVDEAPTVTLNAPTDTATAESLTVMFNYTPIDDRAFLNCSVFTNISGSFAVASSNASAIINNSINSIEHTFVSGGLIAWNVGCYDNSSQIGLATNNFTLQLDSTAPTDIVIVDPTLANATVIVNADYSYLNFTFLEANPSTCTLDWNGVNETITLNSNTSGGDCFVNKTSLSNGDYDFKLYVNDTAGNINVSSNLYRHTINYSQNNTANVTTLSTSYVADSTFNAGDVAYFEVNCTNINGLNGTLDTKINVLDPNSNSFVANKTATYNSTRDTWTYTNASGFTVTGTYTVKGWCQGTSGNWNNSVANFSVSGGGLTDDQSLWLETIYNCMSNSTPVACGTLKSIGDTQEQVQKNADLIEWIVKKMKDVIDFFNGFPKFI